MYLEFFIGLATGIILCTAIPGLPEWLRKFNENMKKNMIEQGEKQNQNAEKKPEQPKQSEKERGERQGFNAANYPFDTY